jgi:integrase
MEATKGRRAILALARQAGWTHVHQLNAADACTWLADQMEAGWSAKTHNNALCRLRAFGKFAKDQNLIPGNPFLTIEYIAGADDGEGVRPLTLEEGFALVHATRKWEESGNKVADTGRWIVYTVAIYTGYRWSELRRLRWEHVNLDAETPHVQLPALKSKNRKSQVLALAPDAVEALRIARARASGSGKVFNTMPCHKTMNADLERAGIAKRDEQGISVSFHSTRKLLAEMLDASHVRDTASNAMMRHANARITKQKYRKARLEETANVAQNLPSILKNLPRSENMTDCVRKSVDMSSDLADTHTNPPGTVATGGNATEHADSIWPKNERRGTLIPLGSRTGKRTVEKVLSTSFRIKVRP